MTININEAFGAPKGTIRALILLLLTGALIYLSVAGQGSTEARTALITMAVTSLNNYLNKGESPDEKAK